MQDTLSQQLASRARRFCDNVGISQRRLAKWLKVEESHLSKFLSGKANLNSECTLALVRLMNTNRAQLDTKFSKPNTATITHFQQSGKPMKLDTSGSWVPGLSGAGSDPNDDGDDITTIRSTGSQGDDPGYDDLTRTLAQVQALHRQAISTIEDYEARQRARVNANGSTGPARQISRPKTPGPRGDLLP